MKFLSVRVAGIALLLGGVTAAHAEQPTFEISGLPLTLHQINAVDTGLIRESLPAPTTLVGMPVSPHQRALLAPRLQMTTRQVTAKLMEAGYSRLRFVMPAEYTVMGLRDGEWIELIVDSRTGELR